VVIFRAGKRERRTHGGKIKKEEGGGGRGFFSSRGRGGKKKKKKVVQKRARRLAWVLAILREKRKEAPIGKRMRGSSKKGEEKRKGKDYLFNASARGRKKEEGTRKEE